MKRTKIVATIGPATSSEQMLEKIFAEGVNVMRLNFSHGDFAEHQEKLDNAAKVASRAGLSYATLQDLGGPKIRICDFYKESIVLEEGKTFTLTTDKIIGDEKKVYINYSLLPKEVKKGGFIMLHDGKKKLLIKQIKEKEVVCEVIIGGEIKGRRGVNLPGAKLSIGSLAVKDKKDLEFGIKNKVDFIALSFVRRASDIEELRKILRKRGSESNIISKVEDTEALENIESIIEASDGIMIGRGDFGIEIGVENLPMTQKNIIRRCNIAGKPVITATHMLESMISSPVPTRAEVSDIANAVLDGTDAVMLSEETTLGKYPVESVRVMAKVAEAAEKGLGKSNIFFNHNGSVRDSVSEAAMKLAENIDAKVIVALTQSGFTARMIARHRPKQCIVALTPSRKVLNQLNLVFGCKSAFIEKLDSVSAAIKEAKSYCAENKIAAKGDRIVIVAGTPFGKSGTTNTIVAEKL
ncbi:MAG: pyruvate kinase [bacterium]|nr:pyruvate kinase [bacterium]